MYVAFSLELHIHCVLYKAVKQHTWQLLYIQMYMKLDWGQNSCTVYIHAYLCIDILYGVQNCHVRNTMYLLSNIANQHVTNHYQCA